MKKENAKTKFASFVAENYTTMNAFAKSVNAWYGMDIIRTKSRKGAKSLNEWARGECKPRKNREQWSVVKKYIRAVHKMDVRDNWLNILKEGQEQQENSQQAEIQFSEKLDYEMIKSLVSEYEILRKFTAIFNTAGNMRGVDLPRIKGLTEPLIDGKTLTHYFPTGDFGQKIKTAVGTLLFDMICNRMDEIKKQLQCN